MEYRGLLARIRAFRDERDWAQFHNPNDLAISLALESSELLECFQWSGTDASVDGKRDAMREELADIFMYAVYFADSIDIDLLDAVCKKLDVNGDKYPVDSSRGNARKYTDL